MTDPFEQLRLMKEQRAQAREDLRSVMDAHTGDAATTVLIQNSARLSAMLTALDPNLTVDTVDASPGTPAANPTQPAAGAQA